MTNSPKKRRLAVLFIVPSLRRAGAETQVVNLVNGLDAKDFDKHLLIFEKTADQLGRVDKETVHFHHASRTRRWLDFGLVAQISRVIEEEHIDVVHCSLQFAVLWGWLASVITKRKPPVIAALHTTINVDRKSELQDRLVYQWILRRCQGIVFVCHSQQTYWEAKYPFLIGRSDVIYNGVNMDWFEPTGFRPEGVRFRDAQNIPEDAVVLACIARFSPEKGQHLLLNALAAVSHGAVYVVFAGDGPLRIQVEDQAQRLGLASQVRFVGDIPDVRPLLAASDLLVLPSTAVETFSMAMLEALSMGTPVLGSDIGGMGEAVIPHKTGALVPIGDVADLARQISALTTDRAHLRSMGDHGRELVVQQFSETLMVKRTALLIKKIAAQD
jgi:glycosyltransferase involved in cell wall biosynthesis